jgi:hypothetical protein
MKKQKEAEWMKENRPKWVKAAIAAYQGMNLDSTYVANGTSSEEGSYGKT